LVERVRRKILQQHVTRQSLVAGAFVAKIEFRSS
jgi:hypothetical protein